MVHRRDDVRLQRGTAGRRAAHRERPGELAALADLQVPLAQGYHLGRPAGPWAPLTADARQTLTGRNPADSGDTLRRHLEHPPAVTDHLHAGVTLADPDVDLVVLCDEHQRPIALLGEHTAAQPVMKINIDTPVRDAALRAITRTDWAQPLLCTDNAGRYVGVVRMPRLLHALSTG